jgi:hypothetical protein
LLWTDELSNLPHDTPDGGSIVVPKDAVRFFADADLRFTDKPLRRKGAARSDG